MKQELDLWHSARILSEGYFPETACKAKIAYTVLRINLKTTYIQKIYAVTLKTTRNMQDQLKEQQLHSLISGSLWGMYLVGGIVVHYWICYFSLWLFFITKHM